MEPWLHNEVAGARTHALVIGVSRYDHLPGVADPSDPTLLGIKQAETPAASAFRFAEWLRDQYNPPTSKLANIWLLLSASAKEREDAVLAAADDTVNRPTRDNVRAALKAWMDVCTSDPNDVAVLYISGHGVQNSREGSVVLLQDFHDPADLKLLERAVDIGSIRAGMSRDDAAQHQFYFVDACRVRPELFEDYWTMTPGIGIDEPVEGIAKVSKIFFGAASGTTALGLPGEGTLFSIALRDCLRHKAATPLKNGQWGVTTESLAAGLDAEVARLASSFDAEQTTSPGGRGIDTAMHVFEEPPPVNLTITIEPENAAPLATAEVFNGDTQEYVFQGRPFTPIVEASVPPGQFSMAVTVADNDLGFNSKPGLGLAAVPPETTRHVVVN